MKKAIQGVFLGGSLGLGIYEFIYVLNWLGELANEIGLKYNINPNFIYAPVMITIALGIFTAIGLIVLYRKNNKNE